MSQKVFFSAVTIAAILNFAGLVVNLFIAVIKCKMWVTSHRISSSDRILFSVSVTRVLLLGLFLLYVIYLFISQDVARSVYIPTFFLLGWMFLDSSSLWFVTLLNVLYCVKITNLQHSVFLLLKRNLSPKTPRLLLACVLMSALTTLLSVAVRQILPVPGFVTGRNGTEFNINEDILSLVIPLSLSLSLQFIVNVTAASLLINSLRRHIQKMRSNATGFWNPHSEAQVGAMKLMVYFLLLYIPHSVATLLHCVPSVDMDLRTRSMCLIISSFYSPGHSVLIVLTHPKLKSRAKKILCFNKYQ